MPCNPRESITEGTETTVLQNARMPSSIRCVTKANHVTHLLQGFHDRTHRRIPGKLLTGQRRPR